LAESKKPASTKAPAGAKKGARKAGEQKESIPELEDPDALMTATLRVMEWSNKHRAQIAYAILLAAGAVGVVIGISFYQAHKEQQASQLVNQGVTADLAPIRTGEEDPEIAKRLKFYGSEAEKQTEALAAFKDAYAKYKDIGPGIIARIGEAGVHLDRKEWDEAIAAYTEVKGSQLAAADPQIRVRVLEGLGYAREGKGLLDDARAAFVELANVDAVKSAKPLGLYHQGRIDLAKGDRQGAISKLKAAHDAITAPGAASAKYLKDQVEKLLGSLDPSLVPKPSPTAGQIPGMPQGTGPGGKLTKEQIDEFLKSMGGPGGPGGPGGAHAPPPGMPPNLPPNMPPVPPPVPGPAPAPAGSK
jgi:hypothetical protein